MLSEFLAVTTLVVTDVDQAKPFYEKQLGLRLLEETPAGIRFGAGNGSQLTIRRGQPPAGGQTVLHFEVDDIEAVVRDLTSRGDLRGVRNAEDRQLHRPVRSGARCLVQGPSR
jgi:catechol 2,3-dioxygenase-like lactoylglutathione lyase family enzyme